MPVAPLLILLRVLSWPFAQADRLIIRALVFLAREGGPIERVEQAVRSVACGVSGTARSGVYKARMAWLAARRRGPQPALHPGRAAIHAHHTLGERAADVVAGGMGSWGFIGVQTLIIALWIVLNGAGIVHWDPMPFILLNLLFSTQAAYAAPILQLAGNRQAAKDRTRDDLEAQEVEVTLTLLKQNTDLTQQVAELLRQNTELTEQMAALTRAVHDQIAGQSPVLQPAPKE